MQELIGFITGGCPSKIRDCLHLREQRNMRHDLTYVNELILITNRIMIPKSMRKVLLQKLHEGHLGMEKFKRRARDSIIWPGINKDIEKMIRSCKTCQQLLPSKSAEPPLPHSVPTGPWQKVGSDLFQYNSKHYLIIADYYSLFPEVYILNHTKAKDIVEITKNVFARHGVPDEVVTDNGPQYKNWIYKQFAMGV